MTLFRDILTARRQLTILRANVNRIAAERDAARADLQRARDERDRLRAALDAERSARLPPASTVRRNCWTCKNNIEKDMCAIVCADQHPTMMQVLAWIRENISQGRDMPAKTADNCPGWEVKS